MIRVDTYIELDVTPSITSVINDHGLEHYRVWNADMVTIPRQEGHRAGGELDHIALMAADTDEITDLIEVARATQDAVPIVFD